MRVDMDDHALSIMSGGGELTEGIWTDGLVKAFALVDKW